MKTSISKFLAVSFLLSGVSAMDAAAPVKKDPVVQKEEEESTPWYKDPKVIVPAAVVTAGVVLKTKGFGLHKKFRKPTAPAKNRTYAFEKKLALLAAAADFFIALAISSAVIACLASTSLQASKNLKD